MGYEIHITRKTEWFDEYGPEISLEDWKAYIASDPRCGWTAMRKRP